MKAYKEMIKTQQNGQCGICLNQFQHSELEIHHIKYKSKGGDDRRMNLIAVCSHCHRLIHKQNSGLTVWAKAYNEKLLHTTYPQQEEFKCIQLDLLYI
jgi:5-methylcytosine-specific restriction endonuclease McrA